MLQTRAGQRWQKSPPFSNILDGRLPFPLDTPVSALPYPPEKMFSSDEELTKLDLKLVRNVIVPRHFAGDPAYSMSKQKKVWNVACK
jgi:uncharacterized protein YqcC (DUF446 family)